MNTELPVSPLIGTSWKMNLTRPEARAYLRTLRELLGPAGRTIFVLPPFTNLSVAEEELSGTRILYGAQDVHADSSGPHTGDISASMLAELGCRIVEVGHSERRRDHCETDQQIGRKMAAILGEGMWPLLCVGKSAADHEAGIEVATVDRQLRGALGWMSSRRAGANDRRVRTVVGNRRRRNSSSARSCRANARLHRRVAGRVRGWQLKSAGAVRRQRRPRQRPEPARPPDGRWAVRRTRCARSAHVRADRGAQH